MSAAVNARDRGHGAPPLPGPALLFCPADRPDRYAKALAAADLVYQLPARAGEAQSPRVVGLPISFDRKRPRSARPAPKLGEHTEEVLGRSTTK